MSQADSFDQLDQKDAARFLIDLFHRIAMHYGMWYAEVYHQLGQEEALGIMDSAWEKSSGIQLKRLSKTLGFELEDGIPRALLDMPREKLDELAGSVAVNWLANDGVWFQSVEFSHGMFDAKRCNDTCWTRFSPFEAHRIKKLLGIPEYAGLDGLKKALQFRLYAFINVQSIVDETDNSFLFQMNDCRVQGARKRKGLDDYPCKSGGMSEYPTFARTIDPRIHTECVGCPPDEHPEEWFCCWRFILEE